MVKNPPASAGDARDSGLITELERSPEREMRSHFSSLPGKSHGQRSWADYSPWGCKRD